MIGSEPCLTCGGTPPASGLPCICGGVGTRDAETDGLRRYAFELESVIGTVRPALKWVLHHAPSPDPHALAGHAKIALERISEIGGRFKSKTDTAEEDPSPAPTQLAVIARSHCPKCGGPWKAYKDSRHRWLACGDCGWGYTGIQG